MMTNNQQALSRVREYDPVGDRERALEEERAVSKTETFHSEILVQQYKYGQPFPNLYGQLDSIQKLPKEAQIKLHGPLGDYYVGEGGMTAKFGIVMTINEGLVLVKDGEYMQISAPSGGLDLPACIGRVPSAYKPKS